MPHPASPSDVPRVRAVIVNYNGGAHVERCLESLLATDWPADHLEVVVVDNASTDGSPDRIARRFSNVRLIRSERNLGFAGANNLALTDIADIAAAGVDLVALVNPDATVEPGWLRPLATAVTAAPDVGAANPKLLLEPSFAPVRLTTETFTPGHGDDRHLGVTVSGVRTDGAHDADSREGDRWDATVFSDGFSDEEVIGAGLRVRWSGAEGLVWLPVPAGSEEPHTLGIRLSAEREKAVEVSVHGDTMIHTVGPDPTWVQVEVRPPFTDLINDTGAELVRDAFAANRGLGEPDDGRFDTTCEVFAWTASVVLLDVAYLRDVGLFDESLFMYYEDFDLSWRGRSRGWRYLYVPESRARHVRGAIAGVRSPLVEHLVARNGLVVLVKNAPWSIVRREWLRAAGDVRRLTVAEILRPLRRRNRPAPVTSRRRARSLAAAAARVPAALARRWRIRRRATLTPRQALEDYEPRRPSDLPPPQL